jgi:3-oxoacyl-[acyl-carrier protein] reductase
MKELGFGRIINIISTSVKQVIPGLGVSNTTRGAVANWARTLALELGQFGITVNNILPGYTDTGRLQSLAETRAKEQGVTVDDIRAGWVKSVPLARIGKPDEIASAVSFLASDAAGYINGADIPVDGGRVGI